MARIFISRAIKPNTAWAEWAISEGHQVHGVSCIQTQPISFQKIQKTDWIFFSSSEGARYYFSQCAHEQEKIAAMGPGTAETLKQLGIAVDWMGSASDPLQVAQAFRKQLSPAASVLFPQSAQTKNSIAPHLSDIVTHHVTVYDTCPQIVPTQYADIWIFSSPSNVMAYQQQHGLDSLSSYIAYGPTTALVMQQLGLKNIITLEQVTDQTIIEAIKESLLG
jgi:uroporphyrinogen-III synthase